MRILVRPERRVTIRSVQKIIVSPSVTGDNFEVFIETGYTNYSTVLNAAQLLNMLRSASAAVKKETPPYEERESTQLPMNPDTLFVVRPYEGQDPKQLYHKIFDAWRSGYFIKYTVGTCQQFVREDDIKNFKLEDGYTLKTKSSVFILDGKKPKAGDILMQRISGTCENIGRPFFIESGEPLVVRGA